jgi:hypothetical protein
MSTTLDEIATYLSKHGLRYRIDPAKRQLFTAIAADNVSNFLIVVQLDEKGEFFKLFAPDLLPGIKEHRYQDLILQTLLNISWETKMLQWEYDPIDGEVRAMIEFPLEDAQLTERQFFRCLSGLVEMVDNFAMPRLKRVMQLDEDIEEGERWLLILEQEAPGLLPMIDKALRRRKKEG